MEYHHQNPRQKLIMLQYLKKQFTLHKLLRLKLRRNQIVRFAPLGMMPTRIKFGVLAKWKPITYRPGVRMVKAILRIAKCYVKPTIEQKEIDKEPHLYNRRCSENYYKW